MSAQPAQPAQNADIDCSDIWVYVPSCIVVVLGIVYSIIDSTSDKAADNIDNKASNQNGNAKYWVAIVAIVFAIIQMIATFCKGKKQKLYEQTTQEQHTQQITTLQEQITTLQEQHTQAAQDASNQINTLQQQITTLQKQHTQAAQDALQQINTLQGYIINLQKQHIQAAQDVKADIADTRADVKADIAIAENDRTGESHHVRMVEDCKTNPLPITDEPIDISMDDCKYHIERYLQLSSNDEHKRTGGLLNIEDSATDELGVGTYIAVRTPQSNGSSGYFDTNSE